MSDILNQILRDKAVEVVNCAEAVTLPELARRVENLPPPRGFTSSIREKIEINQAAVIAEIKKASPSKGIILIQLRSHGLLLKMEQPASQY